MTESQRLFLLTVALDIILEAIKQATTVGKFRFRLRELRDELNRLPLDK